MPLGHEEERIYQKINVQYIALLITKFLSFKKHKKRGQRYTNCTSSMILRGRTEVNVGEKVIFNCEQIETFKKETASADKAVRQYQQLVLAGIDQIGVVKELQGNLTNVSFPDGWELPIPTKYLIVLHEDK